MAVDGTEMVEVERPLGSALHQSLRHQQTFGSIKPRAIGDAKAVVQHPGRWIDVGVVNGHAGGRPSVWRMCAWRRSCGQPSRSNISNMATSSGVSGFPSMA